MGDDEAPSDLSLLVIVVDTNPNQRYITEDPKVLTGCLDALIAFANSHLMQKARNQLAVIGCHFHKSEYLYPSPGKPLDVRQIDGQYELFTLVEKTIKMRLVNLIKSQPQEERPGESLLAGAMAMGLCFISRMRREAPLGLRISSRMLIVTGSSDTAAQYINYMNVFFTAQKQQVLIDVCSLDKHLSLLQQGCDITGGLYLKAPSLDGLLQYLLWVFLPEAHERRSLVLPGRGRVDYRAACFCHRELLTIGYVCSVCLSVFCKFSPICTTCQLVNLIKSQPQEERPGESLLAGAMAMGLCFISRMRREAPLGLRISSRMLIVTGSSDTAAQYINYMNVFFTAQKQQVLIDVCSLDKHLSLLQQGCDITGGLYLKAPSLDGLLQYLLWVFLPEAHERRSLVLPGRGRVDYRAACFCHRELLTIGYVCSVCLSVFCKFSPICTTCHTVFKIGGPLPIKPKKKKMKV